MKIDKLLLDTGGDIPFYQARVTIHQPRLKEIALIGEENFHIGSHFLIFNKNNLPIEGKVDLESQTNFNIFMSVMNSREKAKHKVNATMLLALLFPQAKIKFETDKILLQLEEYSSSINENNFTDFQSIVSQIFCLGENGEGDEFNPADDLAKKIAEKIKKAKAKRNKQLDENGEIKDLNLYEKYLSILAVGLQKDKNDLSNYTVYQIRDEFKRFQMKQDFDIYIKAKLAGAQDLEEVENWMETIRP